MLNFQFVAEEVPRQVIVPSTSQFLTRPITSIDTSVPLIFDAKLSGKVLPVGGLIAPGVGLLDIQQPQLEIQQELIQQQRLQLQPQLAQIKVQEQVKVLQPQLDIQQPVLEQKVSQELKQQLKQQLKLQQKVKQKQQQELQQRFQQVLQRQPSAEQKITFIPKAPTFELGQLQRIAKEIKEKPEKFSVFITKKGKDVKTKTFATLPAAKKELVSTLKKTIAAGGFIKENGRKIPFNELGIGTFGEFRRSKKDPAKIIQKKSLRLGTFGETSELKLFRALAPPKKKGKRKKDPFGFNF